MSSVTFKTIAKSPTDLAEILRIEESLVVPHFTTADAFDLGLLLQKRLTDAPKPALISIVAPSGLSAPLSPTRTLFQCSAKAGVSPDNEVWVARKAQTVFRFGVSSWYMGQKLKGDEKAFAAKFGLSPTDASKYAIHGGAVPVRVKGVEAPVAVVIVSGLSQDEDNGVVVEVLQEWIKSA
ncbi:hypothetical protein V491_02207 [Pseudogymnoascus sp. VKM F-3775]|nr:hypothetical protein V491_02207 [Pseudogymnoascus sp. VKM F-3775]